MLRIIMDACGIRRFGVCDAAALTDGELEGSVIAVVFPNKLENGRYVDSNKARSAAMGILNIACEALSNAFGAYGYTPYLDDGPVCCERAAALSGLGVIGRPGWFISRHYGTDCFIGIIVTKLQFPKTGGEIAACEDCGRCTAACPEPGACVHSGMARNLPERPECTLCREACPHNESTWTTYIKAFE